MRPHFHISQHPDAAPIAAALKARYGHYRLSQADVIIVLGGDGTNLDAVPKAIRSHLPIFSLNLGHRGYLSNALGDISNLPERIAQTAQIQLQPLHWRATKVGSTKIIEDFAINEVQVCSLHPNAAVWLQVAHQDEVIMQRFGGSGLLVASALGSTGLNRSAGGPILPLESNLWALTPYHGFTTPAQTPAIIAPTPLTITVHEAAHRPAQLTADRRRLTHLAAVEITQSTTPLIWRFDAGATLHRKARLAQFPDLTT